MVQQLSTLPPPKFQVWPESDIFDVKAELARRNRTSAKVKRVVLWILSVLIVPVALVRLIAMGVRSLSNRLVLPATFSKDVYMDRFREDFLSNSKNHAEQVTVETADGVKLDTVTIKHPDQKDLPAHEQKWILKFGGNGEIYESGLLNTLGLSKDTGANYFIGNFRGVMRSEGRAKRAQDLILDGEAMLQYLFQKGVRPENILIHGHSLGGGVGTAVAARHPGVNVCNDRSFSSIKAVVGPFIGKLIERWNFDSVKNYQAVTGKKFVIYSQGDGIIRYPASLHKALSRVSSEKVKTIQYSAPYGYGDFAHNVSLSHMEGGYSRYLIFVREILGLKKQEPVLASFL